MNYEGITEVRSTYNKAVIAEWIAEGWELIAIGFDNEGIPTFVLGLRS